MDKKSMKAWISNHAEAVAQELHMEVVEVNVKQESSTPVVEILLYKEAGLTLDDCANYSRQIGAVLDEDDKLEDAYLLEVSSPGLDRPIKTEDDYRRSIGKLLEAKLYRQVGGRKTYVGVLESYDKEHLNLLVDEDVVSLQRADVAKLVQAIVF